MTPTLAGHRAGDNRSSVSHNDYVQSVLRELDATSDPVVLVGHSFGGSVISRVAEVRPEHCRLLIYCSAFVPGDGERVADSLPESMIAFLQNTAAASPDSSVVLPLDLFRSAFANTVDQATADALYPLLVRNLMAPSSSHFSYRAFTSWTSRRRTSVAGRIWHYRRVASTLVNRVASTGPS
jgi:pimeloyl-ACP methyl ester carboxylesterase